MLWNLIVCPERVSKQGMVMLAVRAGMGGTIVRGDADHRVPFVGCGQLWAMSRMVQLAMPLKTPYWIIDNGYYMQSGKGRHETGHWEFTYRGLEPIVMDQPDFTRLPYDQHVKPWREKRGKHVLIGIPGLTFGRMFGWDMKEWVANRTCSMMFTAWSRIPRMWRSTRYGKAFLRSLRLRRLQRRCARPRSPT
jgi:hypothetical protein